MRYTPDQLKAAYALNLCTVSVSQIIDYADVNVMEQEYEAILNNLNLEQMPKDEALLNVLKQILDTITFFRILERDKEFIDREYQQRIKNAIWSAVPNLSMLVAGGDWKTMAISLACQVGIGYMNYRRAKSDAQLDYDKQRWALERTAIEQFNGLRRELFDTAWRLADSYGFPDQLRLTERQIKQYNNILMDGDILRKYERLESIKDFFIAYPPFWYHFGNTANMIARSDLPLSSSTRNQYRAKAREYFEQYRESNRYGLLRDDPISSSCALELIDLLDINRDRKMISELLAEAVRYSGNANDILQLAAITYLKLGDRTEASSLLRQLVNEQYNTMLNAQFLSAIYVFDFRQTSSHEAKARYEALSARVSSQILFPMPARADTPIEKLETEFISLQQRNLTSRYRIAFRSYFRKYAIRYGKLVPAPEDGKTREDDYYLLCNDDIIAQRKYDLARYFSDSRKASYYQSILQEQGLLFPLLDLLNEMYDHLSPLDVMNDAVKSELEKAVQMAIITNKNTVVRIQSMLNEGQQLSQDDINQLLDIRFDNYTYDFFSVLWKYTTRYIDARSEIQDFAIAERNLVEFCEKEGLPIPSTTAVHESDDNLNRLIAERHHFDISLFGEEAVAANQDAINARAMIDIIKAYIPRVVRNTAEAEFYTDDGPRVDRYFNQNDRLRRDSQLKAQALAILDDTSKKNEADLVFTLSGIVAIRNDVKKPIMAYSDIKFTDGDHPSLSIDGRYAPASVDVHELNQLILQLKDHAKPIQVEAEKEHTFLGLFRW